jgi:piezo-type mechanosensitive ion channel component 1/2
LPSSGESMTPDVITDDKIKKNVTLTKFEDSHGYYYWEVGIFDQNDDLLGLSFFTISEKFSPMTFNFSVITFYISVVGLAGRLLRYFLAGPSNLIMTEMPNPEPIINLSNGIYLSRMTGDLLREEELYYELVDIIRSPEMLKLITGRSSIKEKQE